MVEMKMMLSLVVGVLAIGNVLAAGVSSARHGVKVPQSQRQSGDGQAAESVPETSEVEYVDGPLAPLYDFLIQRRLQRFCKLLRDAGLEQTIQDLGGSFTLFVPTDASFVFLPGGTLDELQRNPALLRDFVLYHFVVGDFPSNQIQNEMLVDSVQGSPLRFNIYGQLVTVSGAQILEPDVLFDMGRIYIIDRPLHPIPSIDIASYLQNNHRELYRMLVDTGLLEYVSSGTFTFLVPDDQAFGYLSADLKDALAANRSLAEQILLNHLLPGSLYVGGVTDGMQWETVGGSVITFTVKRGLIFANDIPIVLPDVPLTNGVIHVINRVLLPDGIEADCQCKPSSDTFQTHGRQTPGNAQPSFGRTPRPQVGQTTRRPWQSNVRQPSHPVGGQDAGSTGPISSVNQVRPPSHTVNNQRPQDHSIPGTTRRPWNTPRTSQATRPVPTPAQNTRPPFVPPAHSEPENDINSVVGFEEQVPGQKRPGQTASRYPPPPFSRQQPHRPESGAPTRTPESQPENESHDEQDISVGVTQTTRQTDRWSNRQRTPAPRYPTPQRGPYRPPATTRQPQTTRRNEWNRPRVTQPAFVEQPAHDEVSDIQTGTEQPSHTQRPTTSWNQRRQTTRQPVQRTTYRPSRVPPVPQRRPTPARPGNVSPSVATTKQPFESNQQKTNCRLRSERLTNINRNLPVCSETQSEECQNLPFNPADSRPLCPEVTLQCRNANEPYNPSDNRPLCSSPEVNQDCRPVGEQTYPGDRRPLCPGSPVPQTGCKDPSAPYNPSDRRPLCRPNQVGNVPSVTNQDSSQGCRKSDETADPNDRRPICPSSAVSQTGCKDPSAPYNPSDRRPVCRPNQTGNVPSVTNRDSSQGCRQPDEIFNPNDRRPLCPSSPAPQTGCKDPSAPYNPSDRRPVCPPNQIGNVPSVTNRDSSQGCRQADEIVNPNDRRPLCPSSSVPQTGCKDPSAPYNPSDRRPLCSPNRISNVPSVTSQNDPQGCRQSDETVDLNDRRPLCPEEPQEDCRPFLERPKPGDRRPICKTNVQQRQKPGSNLDQKKPTKPVGQPNYPQGQRTTQTTRRQSWQSTTRYPPSWQSTAAVEQPVGKQPQTSVTQAPFQPQRGSSPDPDNYPTLAPLAPQSGGSISSPRTGSQPPSGPRPNQPQTGTFVARHPSQPQTPSHQEKGTRPSQPTTGPVPPQTGFRPSQPHTGFGSSQPHTGSRPSQQHTGSGPSQPHAGPSDTSQPQPPGIPTSPAISGPSQPNFQQPGRQHQQGRPSSRYPQPNLPSTSSRQPQVPGTLQRPGSQGAPQPGSADAQPDQPLVPQGRPWSGQRQPTGPFTQPPRRVATTTRVPVSVAGTSSTPTEDSRRTLYEIVEDPALLIRGRPIMLTRIFSLFHKAGIEDVLTGPGPTTVFLPSDDAFATLPKGVVDQLEENPDLLRQVLLYHVTNSEILPSAQGESYTVPSLEGTQLVITMLNGGRLILISGAKAVAVTRANNGIFYVINQLLYPLPHRDIFGAIQSRPDLSIFSWLLTQSGLAETLQGDTPYTVLAPTDTAFAQLPQSTYDELTLNTTALREVLLNHIVEGAHYGREFLTGVTLPSARGGKLRFQVVSYGYQVNDINIKTPEIVTGSGVIHLIDQLLLEDPDQVYFSNLANAIGADDGTLNNQPQSPGQPSPPRGSVVPSAGGPTQIGGLQPTHGQTLPVGRTPAVGQNVPGNQPQPQRGTAFGGSPVTSQRAGSRQPPSSGRQPQTHNTDHQPSGQPNLPGQNLRGTQGQTSQGLGGSTTGQSNAINGHRPGSGTFGQRPGGHGNVGGTSWLGGSSPSVSSGQAHDVAELARSMGLNQFANWVTNTGLLEKIHDGGVYTVFAPTDDAVNALPQDMVYSIESNPEQVKPILQYHIVPQRLNLNAVSNEETASTLLQGKKIRFNVYDNPSPGCRQLVTASGTPLSSSLATMGTVQVIPVTQVLYQPAGDLQKIIDSSPILQKLSEAVKSARLAWILSGSGPITIFAPSDTAFNSLTEDQKRTLIEDKQAFSDILKRHIVRGTFFSSGVQEDIEKNSENGKPISLTLREGILNVNSVPVTYADITASNGVLHVIDQFLLN